MQIKSILLIVVIGAVAVLAKKGSSSSSEEDRYGFNIPPGWAYGKPGRGPKPFKFKGPKHQVFVVGRPQYQQSLYPQGPQYPMQGQVPQYPIQGQIPQYPIQGQVPQYPVQGQIAQYPMQPQRPQYAPQPQVPQYAPQPQEPQYPSQPQRPQYPPQPQEPQYPSQPQRPQYPSQSQKPQFPSIPQEPQFSVETQGVVNPLEVQQYLNNVQRQMQDFSAKAYKEFQAVENEIDRNRKHMEDSMKHQFQSLELILEAKQAKEIQQAVKEGKDELKIQECLADEEQEVRADMNADIQRTTDCVNDATERARKAISEARNAYTESSIASSMQSKEWAQKMKSCAEQKNPKCVKEGMDSINEKTKNTVAEGSQYFQKLQDVPQRQKIQMDYCRENFLDDLKDMKAAYSKMVKRCVIASEIQEPEEEDDEEEKDGKVNLDVNVQVKPEAEE